MGCPTKNDPSLLPMVDILVYQSKHFSEVEKLWAKVFPGDPPWNHAENAIPEKLRVQPELFLVAEVKGNIVGTAMAGYDGHRGWLYTIAVEPSHQRRGIGSRLLKSAERKLLQMGCKKINLQIRADNDAVSEFYRCHGYATEERISMGKRVFDQT